MERLLTVDPVCFFCEHWQSTDHFDNLKRERELMKERPIVPPVMEGQCLAVLDPATYLKTSGGYAHVEPFEHTPPPQYPCDVGIKEGGFLGIGGEFKPAFKIHPSLREKP